MPNTLNVQLHSSTVSIAIVHRFSGATKNAKIRITYKLASFYQNPSLRVSPPPYIGLTQNPPGGAASAALLAEEPPPPEPVSGASPSLVQWPAPNRPPSLGTLLEAEHDFETSLPSGWTTVANGNGSLSRTVGTSLEGNAYMRSVKSIAGP